MDSHAPPASEAQGPNRRTRRWAARLFGRLLPRRILRDERGSAAVEFALVSVPFFMLVTAILESALVFFANQVLETAVADAGRLIRTGQAHQQGFNEARFRQEVCNRLVAMFPNCAGSMLIDVRSYTSFAAVDVSKPISSSGTINAAFTYNHGAATQIVVVRAYYEWPLFFNRLGLNLADLANGNRLLGAVTAFRNEPFPW